MEQKLSVFVTNTNEPNLIESLLSGHSSLRQIQRILGYILRFINNCKSPNAKLAGNLLYQELHSALLTLVKFEQYKHFKQEIAQVQNHRKLPKCFQKLNIFLDDQGLVRVGGRLHHSLLSYDKKYPLLLPRTSRLTYLIIHELHLKYLHAGLQTVQYLLHRNFWILSSKRAIRHVLSQCVRCFRVKPRSFQPLMGNLPTFRISQVKPFSHTGLDFAGPFFITLGKTRGAKTFKAYICLFVCLAVKAIHLELVSSLTADAFIAALRRFVARRGRVSNLYSDNATNFVRANKELFALYKTAVSSESIQWHFIPPSAPHFGGIWEAGVKSVKTHLVRVTGNHLMTYEEFYTVLCQIESILNSRPLTPCSSDLMICQC